MLEIHLLESLVSKRQAQGVKTQKEIAARNLIPDIHSLIQLVDPLRG